MTPHDQGCEWSRGEGYTCTCRRKPRRFQLDRRVDESGMSGTGIVAEGIQLPNGLCVMWWLVPPHSVQIYPSIADMHFIHQHGARKTTDLVWLDPAPPGPRLDVDPRLLRTSED